jgi:protein-S-isoprenylcysteine O-methyltransferase Ste14
MKLLFRALLKYLAGVILVGALIFLPAGVFFRNGILFMLLLFLPILLVGVILFLKSPKLLERRLDAKEKVKTQQTVLKISALLFILGFVVAGLDYRFSWSQLSDPIVYCASAVLLISYALYAEVLRENAYLSRTIQVEKGQKVVDRGLYAIVRHPMYAVTLWLFLSIPLTLGSLLSLIFFLPYGALFVVRIINEEKVLSASLPGYEEYKKKVRYRLFPYIW